MRIRSRAASIVGLAAIAVSVALISTTSSAGAVQGTVTADELPPFAVEDFEYPQADAILAERGILLKRGDGHIVLADCGSQDNLLIILARNQPSNRTCFRTTGPSGFLTLELPAVFGVVSNDYATTRLDLSADGEEETFSLPANSTESIGEGSGGPDVLVEIRVTQ